MYALLRSLTIATLAVTLFARPAVARATTLPPLPRAAESFDVGMLHVDRYGTGPKTIVLIPGLSCGPWVWAGTIAHELPNATIYSLTLPGFDGRPFTAQRPLFTAFLTDFATLLDTRHIQQPIVVGHSLGGTLAIALGETYPDRLAKVIAVDGLPVFPTLVAATADQRTAAGVQAAAAVPTDPAKLLAAAKQFMSGFGIADQTLVDPTAALIVKSLPAATAAWIQEDLSGDLRPALPKLTVPLVEIMPFYAPDHVKPPLQYTQDQTQALYASLLAGAPKATVVPLPNARHFAMLDQPDAFYTALDTAMKN